MRPAAWFALVLVLAGVAGCIDPDEQTDLPDDPILELLAPPLDEALWEDPQQFPHPGFGWPTITHVPEGAPAIWAPIDAVPLPDDIQGLEHLTRTGESSSGDGIAVFGSLLVSPGWSLDAPGPMEIYDISDPATPTLLSSFTPDTPFLDVDLIAYPDGGLVAVFPTLGNHLFVYNLTDPEAPEEIAVIEVPSATHTVNVLPGTPILYNANTVGTLPVFLHEAVGGTSKPQTEIYDLSDPAEPVLVQEFQNGYGCHAISFHITEDRQRAYCAGHDAVQIWDVADPRAPEVLTTFPMPHGTDPLPSGPYMATIAHWAVVNRDATVLAIADETGGGMMAACDAHLSGADRTVSGPIGNIWFYDIRDERQPELLGWISPGAHFADNPPPHEATPIGSCTAHIGRMVPDPDRDLLLMTFYAGGVGLIDFTDPAAPFFVDRYVTGGQASDAWYYNGYAFVGDIDSGLDVLRFR